MSASLGPGARVGGKLIENVEGSKEKADQALSDSKDYTDSTKGNFGPFKIEYNSDLGTLDIGVDE